MRGWFALAGMVLLACTGQDIAQPTVPAFPPSPLPVLPALPTLPPSTEQSLPGGSDVSQPLQPVLVPPPESTPPPVPVPDVPSTKPAKKTILGDWWDSDELLIWWPKAQPLPALVTGSRGAAPVLGTNTTSLLIGNHTITTQDIAGYRLALGWSLDDEDTIGFEGRYFFLGTRTLSQSISDLGNDRVRALGLPYINALTGQESVLSLAIPGVSSAMTTVSTTTRVQGAEANFVGNLYASDNAKLHAIIGYRYLQANEGLRIESQYLQYSNATLGNNQTFGSIADQIDAHNEFHGGQIGLTGDMSRGSFFMEVTGKAAFGTNFEMVRLDGQTNLVTAANPIPLLQSYHGGVFAQSSNIGQYNRAVFAVVPEATCKFGVKFSDRGRIFVGYNFLYLSNAVRPGDQINRTINPAQIPLLSRGAPFTGPDQPQVSITRSDFWTQGLVIGLETRF